MFPAARCGLDFTVSVPEQCPASGCGFIMDVHGFGMSADIQDRNTDLRRLGRENGFVVAQPTANGQTPSFNPRTDSPRLRAFMEQAIQAFDIDPKKVHFGGFSQGAGLTYEFICSNSDLLASAAPIAGMTTDNGCFRSGPPIPLLQTNGTRDQLAPFARASATRDAILAGMGLSSSDGVRIASGRGITQTRFMNSKGQVYEFIEHTLVGASVGAGHCFPGSFEAQPPQELPGRGISNVRFACEDDASIRIGEAQIQFYMQNPKR